MKKAVIVIPTYNEQATISSLIKQIFDTVQQNTKWEIHILVVDSNSPDNTYQAVEKLIPHYPRLHVLKTKKEGLGKAYIQGFKVAIEKLNPYVLFEMDADFSHNPKDIPAFIHQIENGADFVIGSRYIKGGSIPSDWGLHRKIFSIAANLFVRFGFMKLSVTDWTDGFRAIKVWVIKKAIHHVQNYSGYVFQVALLDFAITHHAHIREIPVNFIDRKEGVSKINSLQYIIQTIFYVCTHSSFIKFVLVGLFGFVVDFSFAYVFINALKIPKALSNMLSAEIAIVINFLINNFWSFRHKQITGGFVTYIKKFMLFNFVSLGSVLIQGIGLALSLKVFGDYVIHFSIMSLSIQSWILYKVCIIAFIIIPYSYVLYNKVVWKK